MTGRSTREPGVPAPLAGTEDLFTLDRGLLHLNHGSYGAVPLPVQRLQQRLRTEQEQDPDGFFAEVPQRVAAARAEVAAALGADPARLALVTNVTEGAAVALETVPLAAGDRILVTDHGYGAVTRAVLRRAGETGAAVDTVRLPLDIPDEKAVREAVLAGVGPRTTLAVLDLVTSPTARLVATAPLLRELRARGVTTVVDAAHAPGMLPGPVDGHADFWLGNLHKWAFAPRATAVLAVSPWWASRVRPLALSWEHDRGFPGNVEFRGTCDYTPWLAAPAGLGLLQALGPARVRRHNERLAAYGQRVLAERAGLQPLPAGAGVSMRALRLPPGCGESDEQARAVMAAARTKLAARIVVRPWPGGGVLRVSAQLYNRPHEYETLAAGLAGVLRG